MLHNINNKLNKFGKRKELQRYIREIYMTYNKNNYVEFKNTLIYLIQHKIANDDDKIFIINFTKITIKTINCIERLQTIKNNKHSSRVIKKMILYFLKKYKYMIRVISQNIIDYLLLFYNIVLCEKNDSNNGNGNGNSNVSVSDDIDGDNSHKKCKSVEKIEFFSNINNSNHDDYDYDYDCHKFTNFFDIDINFDINININTINTNLNNNNDNVIITS